MRDDEDVHPAAFVSEVALYAAGGGDGVGGQVVAFCAAAGMRYGVAGFGCRCAVLWVLLCFGVFEGHVSSVSGWGGGVGGLFLLSHAGIFCGFVCGSVCLRVCNTPKTAILSEFHHFFL